MHRSVRNGVSLYIDAGNASHAQQYNRFDGRFQGFKPLSDICNFTFDTLKAHPYKRGSHGERGVPKTSRVIATKGSSTQTVPASAKGLGLAVVRSMHRLFGKGYASGGGRLHHRCECFCRR